MIMYSQKANEKVIFQRLKQQNFISKILLVGRRLFCGPAVNKPDTVLYEHMFHFNIKYTGLSGSWIKHYFLRVISEI